METVATKLHVAIVGPPVANSGGIGTLFRYARPHFPTYVDVSFIDTRGTRKQPVASLVPWLAAFLKLARLKYLGRLDVVHINFGARGSAIRKLPLLCWSRFVLRTPVVMQLHAATFEEFFSGLPSILQLMVRNILNSATRVLVLGQIWHEMLVNAVGVHAAKVSVFVMGVPDLTTVVPAERHFTTEFSGVFAGELGPRKGSPQLLRSLLRPELKEVSLTIAGSGSTEESKTEVQVLTGCGRLRVLGLVPPSTVHAELAAADFLILPSRAEGLPVSVLEGLAAKRLVITTLSGALGEHLVHNRNCLVLDDNSEESIVRSLAALPNIDLEHIAEEGHNLWNERFDVAKTTQALVRLWQSASLT